MNLQEATMKALQGRLFEDVQLTPSINKQRELYDKNVVVTCDVNKIKLGKILKTSIVGPGSYNFLPEVYPWVKQSYNSKFM